MILIHILLSGRLCLSGLRRKGVVLCECAMYGLDESDLCGIGVELSEYFLRPGCAAA